VSDDQVEEVIEKVREAREHAGLEQTRRALESKSGIIVEGLNDLAVRFSKCCSPVPGDEIIGFVTRGRGVSIHRTDCVNMINLPENERNRIIEAEWSENAREGGGVYPVEIVLYCNNRSGVLMDVSRVFTESGIDVKSMNVRTMKNEKATINVGFEIRSVAQLDELMRKLGAVESVNDVERSSNG
ncbi:MAG: bifunctional (p)ppGpp synthetase/guanosine-3',5'-bis(diphosphate) 3'-pyrophosphohydrolase, partial [Eubacterium sp.]|nr:bifunctional (p)ppGpp synthetase/guanosine-3',5'-bis(diphosphate) 3'-pyrophosphohydrolase [Eubacterium sp.]